MGSCQLQGVNLGSFFPSLWPFVFENSEFKISAVLSGQKVVFAEQERHSSLANQHIHYLTCIDLKKKSLIGLFLRNTQGNLSLVHY